VTDPASGGPSRRPTTLRIAVWIVVGAIALFLIGDGILGLLSRGG
jgi:hypothetical protein